MRSLRMGGRDRNLATCVKSIRRRRRPIHRRDYPIYGVRPDTSKMVGVQRDKQIDFLKSGDLGDQRIVDDATRYPLLGKSLKDAGVLCGSQRA